MDIALAHPEEFKLTSTPTDEASGKRYFEKAFTDFEAETAYPLTLFLTDSENPIGTSRFNALDYKNRNCELGFTWFDPVLFGTAVNIESKLLMLKHAFETLEFLRVYMYADTRNLRSQAAIRALGVSYEGTLRNHKYDKAGYMRDSMVFSIIASEWQTVETVLEGRLEKKLSQT